MAKKCPPGVFCIENMTIMYLIIIFGIVGFYVYKIYLMKQHHMAHQTSQNIRPIIIKEERNHGFFPKFNTGFLNDPRNILMNPFVAPLKDNSYFQSDMGDPRGIPINIKTRGFNTNYRQVGILTRTDGREGILALMGRPLHTNRNKWQYYTMSDQNNSIKLPISKNGRSCTNEYGCDELYNSDTVYVEGYNDAYNVTIYENASPQYIPFI
jgi:hypothetical protein